ncbi:MAG TPA: fluoride efflux transporter CrcB [Nitrospira sp.]|nr:fluoride efflux transporter CrcB [Nitrospira sp.]
MYYDTFRFDYLYCGKAQSARVTRLDDFSTMERPPSGSFWSDILRTLFLIGTGGFIGSILRYLVSGYAQQVSKSIQFPFGTLVVNLVGCAMVGFLAELADHRGVISGETRAFLIVGLLGGFTTFSAFGNETMNLLRDGELWLVGGNVVGHVFLSLVAVWLGYSSAYLLWK